MNLNTIHTKIKNHFKSGATVFLKEEKKQIVIVAKQLFSSDINIIKSINSDIKDISINKNQLTLNF